MGYLVVAVLSAFAGGVGTFLAARKFPKQFGFIVSAVNAVDDRINAAVDAAKK